MTIDLYKNSSERNRVDKTNYLVKVGTLTGTLRGESSLLNLSINIEYNSVPDFNYVYIHEFDRYYYIINIYSIRNNLWELSLSVDVLMTYKNGILNSKGFIERSESLVNPNIIDKKIIIEQGVEITTHKVPSTVFKLAYNDDSFCYIVNGHRLFKRLLNQ